MQADPASTPSMPSRPIYRWKSFWLGLFVLLSLLWATWDSTRTVTAAVNAKTALWRLDGATIVGWNLANPDIPWKFSRSPNHRDLGPSFKKYLRDSEKAGFRSIKLPDLPLILLTATLWAIWLLLHAARLKKQNRPAAGNG